MLSNAQLKPLYDDIYRSGSQAFHSVDNWEESLLIHAMGQPWTGVDVLEIGCGEGRLAALLAMSGANVTATDYSQEALRNARSTFNVERLYFVDAAPCERFDVVVMQGVLEHMDDWRAFLRQIMDEHSPRTVITSSPSFLNPRGYVWQALRILLDVPMSLTDVHYICPSDMIELRKMGWCVEYRSCHHDWAAGEGMIEDYRKRLTNALRDAKLPNGRVGELLK